MASIIEYLNRRTREVEAVVDQTFFRLMESTAPLDRFYPITNYAMRELLIAKMSHAKLPMAQILAPNEEVKAVRPQMTLIEVLNKNIKLGQKLVWNETDFELLHRLETTTGPSATQLRTAIETQFFGNVQSLVASIYDKSLYLALRIACLGQCNYTDPISGESVAIDYSPTSGHIATALTGNARWIAAPTTCTPLANLEAHARTVYGNTGRWPQAILMREAVMRAVADSTEAKTAVMRKQGAETATPTTGELYIGDMQVMDLIKERVRCQEVILNDAQYTVDSAAGTQSNGYFLPDDYYVFLYEPGVIERAFVPTVERDFAPGLFQINDIESRLPRREYSAAAGNFIPFVKDERYIAARNINNTAIS